MFWLWQLSSTICTSLCSSRDSVKNLASAANGSGTSVASASRLNVGHCDIGGGGGGAKKTSTRGGERRPRRDAIVAKRHWERSSANPRGWDASGGSVGSAPHLGKQAENGWEGGAEKGCLLHIGTVSRIWGRSLQQWGCRGDVASRQVPPVVPMPVVFPGKGSPGRNAPPPRSPHGWASSCQGPS